MPSVTLYYRPTCGYCSKVLRFIRDNNLDVVLKDVSESSEMRDQLIAISGSTQVPCLVVDSEPIHESETIIEWLKENKN